MDKKDRFSLNELSEILKILDEKERLSSEEVSELLGQIVLPGNIPDDTVEGDTKWVKRAKIVKRYIKKKYIRAGLTRLSKKHKDNEDK